MTGRFRFRLESIETLRRRQRDEQRRLVAEKLRATLQVKRWAGEFADRRSEASEYARELRASGAVDISALRGLEFYRDWLDRKQAVVRRELRFRHKALADQQTELAAATSRLRAIELLRRRQWERYQSEMRRRAQCEMDEAAMDVSGNRQWATGELRMANAE